MVWRWQWGRRRKIVCPTSVWSWAAVGCCGLLGWLMERGNTGVRCEGVGWSTDLCHNLGTTLLATTSFVLHIIFRDHFTLTAGEIWTLKWEQWCPLHFDPQSPKMTGWSFRVTIQIQNTTWIRMSALNVVWGCIKMSPKLSKDPLPVVNIFNWKMWPAATSWALQWLQRRMPSSQAPSGRTGRVPRDTCFIVPWLRLRACTLLREGS